MAHVRPIQTEADYEAALARLDEVFQAESGTPEGDERDLLVDEIVRYEQVHYPIPPPTAFDMIEFLMDQMGLTAVDLVPCVGSIDAVEELLAGNLPIPQDMVPCLENLLGEKLGDLEGIQEVGEKAAPQTSRDLSGAVPRSAGLQD